MDRRGRGPDDLGWYASLNFCLDFEYLYRDLNRRRARILELSIEGSHRLLN